MQIITNNPLVRDKLGSQYPVSYYDCNFHELLVHARDMIHKGYKLLSHPLSGSVKPNETPYKSVLMSDEAGDLDLQSLELIEAGIITADKFPVKYPVLPDVIRADFQLIDYTLLSSAL